MRSFFGCVLTIAFLPAAASASPGNDRLPKRLHEHYGMAIKESQKYAAFILQKVFKQKIEVLKALNPDPEILRLKTYGLVDEIVHLILPYTTNVMQDIVLGSSATYLRITMPDRGVVQGAAAAAKAAAAKTMDPKGNKDPVAAMREAIMQMGGANERELNDRLEQALTEDLEDYVQRRVESQTGLPEEGRPRGWVRPLTDQYEEPYQNVSRPRVHQYTYWWLRKRRRLELTHLASTMTQEELDRAQHTGDIWGLTSGISYEAWAQNRLKMNFKWGRLNFEIDRRRIRRRMDQDEAQATSALAKLVKELSAPETTQEMEKQLEKRVKEELGKGDLQKKAEDYPNTRKDLEKDLQRLKKEMDPIFNKAMAKVELPDDMGGLAREHGRRYMREEMDAPLSEAIRKGATPHTARKRIGERLGQWVGDAMTRFEENPNLSPEEQRKRAQKQVKEHVDPLVQREVEDTLRDTGAMPSVKERDKAVKDVLRDIPVDDMIDKEMDRYFKKD
jgi:hypothetical protein